MKRCARCKQTKSESEFGQNRSRPDGLSHWCRECRRSHHRVRYALQSKAIAARSAKNKAARRETLRQRYFDYLSTHPCVDCGNANPVVLELDHVRGTKRFNVSTRMIQVVPTWESLLQEIAKCDVRCANCHRIKTARQFGYRSLSAPIRGQGSTGQH